jgi:glycosyltransferase involved in cell wall biosynthesis
MNQRLWICCQLGARQHYAVPRALASTGQLAALITDVWAPPGSNFRRLPDWGSLRNVKERFHPALAEVPVLSDNLSAIAFESVHRTLHTSEWPRIMARNRAYQRWVIKHLERLGPALEGKRVTLFAYSYAALEILRYARDQGWQTVLEQIDPGPAETNIVRMECTREYRLCSSWEPPPAGYWRLWREECELADTIVVNSQWTLDCVQEAGVRAAKMKLIPLAYQPSSPVALPPKEYPERFTAERPLRVLFLGQINLRKGVARLLEAAKTLRQEPIEFQMVGPLQFDHVPTTLDDCRIRWLGPVSRGNAKNFYREADLFILPTLSDGFALTQLEALANRLPVIASKFCGAVVRDGVDGRILPSPTANEIVVALRECLREPARLAAWSEAATVQPKFSLASLAYNLAELTY